MSPTRTIRLSSFRSAVGGPLIVAEVGEVLSEKNMSKKCNNTAADVVIIFLNGRLSIFMLDGFYFFLYLFHTEKKLGYT
jgi:hypothetical protein